MRSKVYGLYESAAEATEVFHTFSDGKPELIPTGIAPVDRVLGGLFPGSCGILAAATGAGKSSLVLEAALSSNEPIGIISAEDGPDVVGSRALSWAAGVDSLRIRTKSFAPDDLPRLQEGIEKLKGIQAKFIYAVGCSVDELEDSVGLLAAAGCRSVWYDYIQKTRGLMDDRRNEVSTVYTRYQKACSTNSVVGMAVSQFSRQDPTKEPQIHWLKESGDLENEARLIVLMHRDKDDETILRGRIAKSTYGGEGTRFAYQRNDVGVLEEIRYNDEEDEF